MTPVAPAPNEMNAGSSSAAAGVATIIVAISANASFPSVFKRLLPNWWPTHHSETSEKRNAKPDSYSGRTALKCSMAAINSQRMPGSIAECPASVTIRRLARGHAADNSTALTTGQTAS